MYKLKFTRWKDSGMDLEGFWDVWFFLSNIVFEYDLGLILKKMGKSQNFDGHSFAVLVTTYMVIIAAGYFYWILYLIYRGSNVPLSL